MKVLKVVPGQYAEVVEIDGSLRSMQEMVGGYIQAIYPFDDSEITLVCNDEGKLLGLPMNRALRLQDSDEVFDIVHGTFFLCRSAIELETFVELTPEQMDFCMEYFYVPEAFVDMDGALMIVKINH